MIDPDDRECLVYESRLLGELFVFPNEREVVVPARSALPVLRAIWTDARYAAHVMDELERRELEKLGDSDAPWLWHIEYDGAPCPVHVC